MALAVPLLDSARARTELGWGPRHTGTGALTELLEAMGRNRRPRLAPSDAGPARRGARLLQSGDAISAGYRAK
jgi:hypothetical protein